ncbi:MAG: hypothetical protein ACLSCV_12250 [Acutalibacteraceae bacterium]
MITYRLGDDGTVSEVRREYKQQLRANLLPLLPQMESVKQAIPLVAGLLRRSMRESVMQPTKQLPCRIMI